MFSETLKKLRKEKGLTQVQLAKLLKISKSSISMYENGNREPDFETEELIADFFNVSIDTLRGKPSVNDIEKLQSEDIPILNESAKFLTTGLINPQLIERYKTEVVSYNNRMLLKSLENGALRSYYI